MDYDRRSSTGTQTTMSAGMESMASPALEDWTASCIKLWKVKHMSYLTIVRTQHGCSAAEGANTTLHYLQEVLFIDEEIGEVKDPALFKSMPELTVKDFRTQSSTVLPRVMNECGKSLIHGTWLRICRPRCTM
jgi:hypothetical protein